MKGFVTAIVVFFIYTVICVFIFSYAIDKGVFLNFGSENTENDSSIELVNDKLSQTDLDAIENLSIDREVSDSLYENLEIEDIQKIELESINNPVSGQESQIVVAEDKELTTFNITLPDSSKLIDCNLFAVVFKDQSRVKIPFACREYGISIKAYLDKNPTATLKITGYNDLTENSTIGNGRSDYLKKLLVNVGISSDRIITTAQTIKLDFTSGSAKGGIAMEINKANPIVDQLSEDGKRTNTSQSSTGNNVITSKRFTTGFQDNYYYGDQNFTAYISRLKEVLKKNQNAKVYAYSYTSQESDKEESFAISRDNASTVRKILLQNGIASNKIQSIARGSQPSGTSGSNRCIILVIK